MDNKIDKIGGVDQFFAEEMSAKDFVFDERVANVFDDMVSRSVPMYGETMSAALQLAANFVEPETNIYDIGSATGTLLLAFDKMLGDCDVNLVGIDNSEAMVKQAQEKMRKTQQEERVELVVGDMEQPMGLENASVIFMNYTLQFIRPLHREAVVRQIYEGLNDNGCLILVEKVLGNDSLFNRLYIELYYKYKSRVGYSDQEIKQKREALENVLIPYRIDENIELLKRCGFSTTDIFFKWYNFAGIVAVKGSV
jgi:tRNA (cmo5U34)-methyltransferase